LRYSWLDGLPSLNRPHLPSHIQEASAGLPVGKLVFVECGGDAGQGMSEVNWVAGLAAVAEPRLRGIVAYAPLERGSAARGDLERLVREPLVKGVRRLIQGEADSDFCLRPDFVAGVGLLAEFGLTFDVCIRHEQLRSVTELVRRLPKVHFVLDHLGKPPVKDHRLEPWATEFRALATLPNVSCKLSGLATEADWTAWQKADLQPYVDCAIEAFGFDRLLFGGDWPVSTLAVTYVRWLETVLDLVSFVSETDRKKLFQTNAERIYRI
jgi:L-fuconolactonase